MGDPTFPLIPLASSICLVLTITPLAFISVRDHTGIVLFMGWQSINCIQTIVNRILWNGNVVDRAPVWCDITAKLAVGRGFGIPASIFCMARGIYRIVYMKRAFETANERQQTLLQYFFMAFFLPIAAMCLHVLVSDCRYILIEDYGCRDHTFNTWASFLMMGIWPFVFTLGTSLYCFLVIRKCLEMGGATTMFSRESEIDRFVFSRTLTWAAVTVASVLPVCGYNLVVAVAVNGIHPHPGLAYLRKNYAVPKIVPRSKWDDPWPIDEFLYRSAVESLLPSLIFFMIFGTGEVAVKCCIRLLRRTLRTFGLGRTTHPESIELRIAAQPGLTSDGKGRVDIPLEMEFAENPAGGPSQTNRTGHDNTGSTTTRGSHVVA